MLNIPEIDDPELKPFKLKIMEIIILVTTKQLIAGVIIALVAVFFLCIIVANADHTIDYDERKSFGEYNENNDH